MFVSFYDEFDGDGGKQEVFINLKKEGKGHIHFVEFMIFLQIYLFIFDEFMIMY